MAPSQSNLGLATPSEQSGAAEPGLLLSSTGPAVTTKAYDLKGKEINERDESEEDDGMVRDSLDHGTKAVEDMEGLDADLDGADNYDEDYEEDVQDQSKKEQ